MSGELPGYARAQAQWENMEPDDAEPDEDADDAEDRAEAAREAHEEMLAEERWLDSRD